MDSDAEWDIRGAQSPISTSQSSDPELQQFPGVSSLLESAAKIVAKHVSCTEMESCNPPVDEVLLKRISFLAFPQDENLVKVLSQVTSTLTDHKWIIGEEKFKDGQVRRIQQVGFMVCASVGTPSEESKVSLTFEKQHLTSTSCSTCAHVNFCTHIIAVIIKRIRHANKVPVHAPVTETLSTLTRDQLQKLLQYAINEDPGGVLGRVFEHIDKIRDINSEINQLTGAPDPTFGMFPDEKTIWEKSLDSLKDRLIKDLEDMGEGYKSYKDTCDLFLKEKSEFHDRYFKRVIALTKNNEIDKAGRILITIAEVTFNAVVSGFNRSSSVKRVFLDVERMISCFIGSFTGQIRQDMIKVALTMNKLCYRREASPDGAPTYLVPKPWSEMISIRLSNLNTKRLAKVSSMGGHRNEPFYEPLIASQLPKIPEVLNKLFNKEEEIEENTYDEPLDVMLFRFECIVQYFQMKGDEYCNYKICMLGATILRKLIPLSNNFSILTYDKRRTKIKEAMQETTGKHLDNQEEEINEPPPPKISRQSEAYTADQTKDKLPLESFQLQLDEIQEDMRRSTEDGMFDGLNQAQLCYSMLYVTYRIWRTSMVPVLVSSLQKILFHATLRVFELSRFRYGIPMEIIEASWWEQLMDKIQENVRPFLSNADFKEIAHYYKKALLQSKLSFYKEYLPLPLIDLLRNTDMPYTDQLQLASDVLCYSEKPIYTFNYLSSGEYIDRTAEFKEGALRDRIVKIYKTLLSQIFATKSELPEQTEASRKVLGHLLHVQDDRLVVNAYNVIKENLENIVEKENRLVLLTVILNCIKTCNKNNEYIGLSSPSVLKTLLSLSRSLKEEFPKCVLELWPDLCQFFNQGQLRSIVKVIEEDVREIPSLINDLESIVEKYFTSPFKHERQCCSLLKISLLEGHKCYKIYKNIAQNASYYSVDALLKIGQIMYHVLSQADPSVTIFCKPVFTFLMLGLTPLKDKDVDRFSSMNLKPKESKYLKWFFKKIGECLKKEHIKSLQFKKLMGLLNEVLKKDVNLMLDFYQAMESSESVFTEIKSQLGKGLLSCYFRKFHKSLKHCNHTHYHKIVEEMRIANIECDKYISGGAKEFGNNVVCILRHKYKGKRKLIELMDVIFPECKSQKVVKRGKRKYGIYST